MKTTTKKPKSRLSEIKASLAGISNTVSARPDGHFVARKGYFYTHGQSAEGFAAKVIAALPGAVQVSCWNHLAAFRGGASTAKSSHFGVEFYFPAAADPYETDSVHGRLANQ
jgi:hypothetical protein